MKKKYEKPSVDTVSFDSEEVVTGDEGTTVPDGSGFNEGFDPWEGEGV